MKLGRRAAVFLAAGGLALAGGGALVARTLARSSAHADTQAERSAAAAVPAAIELHVPHATGPIALDGDMDDPGWQGTIARTQAFVDRSGTPARPYSDARFVWGDGHLYVALYAADEDIRATRTEPDAPLWLDDAFHLVFERAGERVAFDVSPLGTLTDARSVGGGPLDFTWQSDAHVSHELDGTPNKPDDDDEEWVLEMAIPFESLGLTGEKGERIGVSVRRCDTPKGGRRVCGTFGENERAVLVLD